MKVRLKDSMCTVLAVAIIAGGVGSVVGAEATSPSAVVWADPSGSLLWKTVRETPIRISIDWPTEAVKAVLTASRGGKELVRETLTDKAVKIKTLDCEFPQSESDESVFDLSLSFFDSSDAILADSSRTASVGLVRGIGGRSFRLIPAGAESGKWKQVKKSAVVPVYVDTQSVTFDGDSLQPTGKPGWASLADVAPTRHTLVHTSASGDSVTVPIVGIGGLIFRIN